MSRAPEIGYRPHWHARILGSLGILGCVACGGSNASRESGRRAAAGLDAGIAAAAHERAPWRCARGAAPPRPIAPHGPTPRIGVVADARGADAATLASLGAIRDAFATANVDAVIAAGGMGTTDDELGRTLAAIAGPWPVVIVPGDREAIPAVHRAVAASGGTLLDGSAAVVTIGRMALGTVGGAPAVERLAAGAEGCTRDAADIDAVLGRLRAATTEPRPARILIAPSAPRGRGASSDATTDGIHVGDLDLAAELAAYPVDLVIHPEVGPSPVAGHVALTKPPAGLALPAGSAAGTPRYDRDGQRRPPLAILVTLEGDQLRWQPVPAAGATLPARP